MTKAKLLRASEEADEVGDAAPVPAEVGDTPTQVPACYSETISVARNPIRQVLVREQQAPLSRTDGRYSLALPSGETVRIAARKPTLADDERALILPKDAYDALAGSDDISRGRWVGNRERESPQTVLASLVDAFSFKQADDTMGTTGLRPPQMGAVHATLGYWTTKGSDPATIVMPTGTGKTETMLALFAVERLERLLVIVPSDALRTQIAEKFETFGVLQSVGVVSPSAHRPVVGQIRHGFKTVEEAQTFAGHCNVIVATPASLYASSPEGRTALLESCTHLFVDEAHHVAAHTWREIRDDFGTKPVVQFTATPFREDGRHLGGRLIYAFPLREAQSQSYFSNINYVSVVDLGSHDEAVAQRAVQQLHEDLNAGHDHLVMARVSRIGRADDVLPIYEKIAADLNPVVLHSTTKAADRKAAIEAIASRASRIVICVNMLGEGFDLPALKIAAIHDAHKSLGVTLQFVGRFARTQEGLGDATVVVGRPHREFDAQLRRLYAEDADWNRIIRDLSEVAVGEQQEQSDFEAAFGSLPDEIAMRSLLPKMSTVVYRVPEGDGWDAQAVLDVFPEERLLTVPIAINEKDGVAWFVTEDRSEVQWGELRTVEEVSYDLYILYWDSQRRLLYINSSNRRSFHETLAKAVCGDSAKRITGENIYRVMAQLQRLVPTNVGLLDVRNASRRFQMLVGADVSDGFPATEAQTKTKTNIFAYGYEEGSRVSVGASLKGRVWSYRIATTLKQWVDWCDHVGGKLIDDGISVDEIMQNFIRPKALEERPPYVPLALEWPWQIFLNMSEELRIEHNGSSWPAIDVELEVSKFDTTGPIDFRAVTADWSLNYRITFNENGMHYAAVGDDAHVTSRNISLAEFFQKNGLLIYLEQDSVVVPPGVLLKPERDIPPFDANKLQALDWSGIELNVESQGIDRRQDSIQARTIAHVLGLADWGVVIDDDGTGEVADIVALRADDATLYVHLTHCKYVAGGHPRAQVEDLYEVCGQAQKSAQWRRKVPALFEYLARRERKRLERGRPSGFMKGSASDLYALADAARLLRPAFEIAIAQPGVTKAGVSAPQLELLAATETYIYETAHSGIEIYCSP